MRTATRTQNGLTSRFSRLLNRQKAPTSGGPTDRYDAAVDQTINAVVGLAYRIPR
ncbi:hypothetical protein GCM10009682_30310 [Luedemannella flava]|uniref:Uncharacterized protein n=1 Tax=Luedemannella flava TaxID=349316 RepID=A0ABP4YDP2_9ACTN